MRLGWLAKYLHNTHPAENLRNAGTQKRQCAPKAAVVILVTSAIVHAVALCPSAEWLIMSNPDDVRTAEKRVQEILRALRETDLVSRDDLHDELRKATDEYTKAVAELSVRGSAKRATRHGGPS